MITEDYVSFETAKLLKEKGFECATPHYYYDEDGNLLFSIWNIGAGKNTFVAPSLEIAMKWLREVHKIDITVDPHDVGNDWVYQFHLCQNKDYLFSRDVDISYENCAEAAIKYCLENLI